MKIYFWFFLLISTYNVLWIDMSNFRELMDLIITVIGLLGIYGYVYKKEFLRKSFWKIFFVCDLLYTIGFMLLVSREKYSLIQSNDEFIFSSLVVLIFLFVYFRTLYKYAFMETG
ncbi:hypothetical protein P4V41_10015 [Fictibacillus nanhaiensis]|uniref:hypothetical protein n=1 Tax=Fictibacillus nanhaiensis TaxID=742169 RepID=UPI002E24EE8F|nr:hypothetical protein [Fictibacillus nanhaiensis]